MMRPARAGSRPPAAREPMTDADRDRWNGKFAEVLGTQPDAPDAFLLECLAELELGPGARVLELAAGAGRNTLALAARGLDVEAWDVSPVGLELLAARCAERGYTARARAVDLDAPPCVSPEFDLVVVVNYLDRDLYKTLSSYVRPGGHVVLAHFTEDWPRARPAPRHRLAAGELARGLPGLMTLRSVEHGGRAGLFARRAPGSGA